MQSWEAAFKKIRKRNVNVWQELSVPTPFDYDPWAPDSYFATFLEENPPEAPDMVFERPDRDVLWAAEIMVTTQKFLHVLRLTVQRARAGHITWASTDAHHALLLGVRCFLTSLGVGICQGKGRAHLVDFRPEKGSPQDVKVFNKNNARTRFPVRVLTPAPKNIDQRPIFLLFNRMVNLVDHPVSSDQLIAALAQLNLGAHKSERNRLLYQSSHWHWLEDMNWPAIELAVMDEVAKESDGLARDFYALSLVTKLVFQSAKPLSSMLIVQKTFLEPLWQDDLCVDDPLSFLIR